MTNTPNITRTENADGTYRYEIAGFPHYTTAASKVLYTFASVAAYGDDDVIVNYHRKAPKPKTGYRVVEILAA